MRNLNEGKGFSSGTTFRPVEEWKAALMHLPDNNFFELLRTVFGNIKTPFNKQRLLDDLFTFLSRNEIRNTIAAFINESDHKLIAAVALLNEPTLDELKTFFTGVYSPEKLEALEVNLEERLVLYRFRNGGVLRCALNPVLKEILDPFIRDNALLFPSFPVGTVEGNEDGKETDGGGHLSSPEGAGSANLSDSRLMAALLAFIAGEEEFYRVEGEIRRKVLDDGKKTFQGIDIELCLNAFVRLGLLEGQGKKFVINRKKTADFSGLSKEEREDYWTAAVYLCLEDAETSISLPPPAGGTTARPTYIGEVDKAAGVSYRFSRNRQRAIAAYIRRFKDCIETERLYPLATLRCFMELLSKQKETPSWGSSLFDTKITLPFGLFISALEKTGVLCRKGGLWTATTGFASGAAVTTLKGQERELFPAQPVLVMDSSFSFILYPEISCADAFELALFSTVKQKAAGTRPEAASSALPSAAVSMALTRQSVVRGFDQGINAERMLELLKRLSGDRIEGNLAWELSEWEKRHAEVTINEGIILSLSEERRYLAEVMPLSSMISKTISPGVYLLSSAERSHVVRSLQKAGVDIIAQPLDTSIAGFDAIEGSAGNYFTRISAPVGLPFVASEADTKGRESLSNEAPPAKGPPPDADSILERLRAVLETIQLSKNEREELAARIERRLVVTESQLNSRCVRYERLEAKGLDVSGKHSVAKEAVENRSFVEVIWPGSGEDARRCIGRAEALEKKGTDSTLVLRESGISGKGETIRIPLEKVSRIRRLKSSIFGE